MQPHVLSVFALCASIIHAEPQQLPLLIPQDGEHSETTFFRLLSEDPNNFEISTRRTSEGSGSVTIMHECAQHVKVKLANKFYQLYLSYINNVQHFS
jgi:hypothetical protein